VKIGAIFSLFLIFGSSLNGASAAPASPILSEPGSVLKGDFVGGGPGCWVHMKGRAITDEQAKTFTPECQQFRQAYLTSIQTFSSDPQKLKNLLDASIENSKSFKPPYNAILLKTFTIVAGETKYLNSLNARAELEGKLNVRYAYAKAAVDRITHGKCSAPYREEFYSEICDGHDVYFERLRKLR
jgi:hypothetical protein